MPLIGIYRGRDRTDNVFRQDFALTDLPLGLNAGAAVIFSAPIQDKNVPVNALNGGAASVFTLTLLSSQDVDLPTLLAGTAAVTFTNSAALALDVDLPLSLQGGT